MIKQLIYPLFLSICFHSLLIGGLSGELYDKTEILIQKKATPEINLAFAKISRTKKTTKVIKQIAKPTPPAALRTTRPLRKKVPSQPQVKRVVPQKAKSGVKQNAASDNYKKVLLSRLARFKKYPKIARRKRIEGDAILKVRINRFGEVLHSELAKSTGSKLLDRATNKILHQASPFPPIPEHLKSNEFEFYVPVKFKLT